MSLLKQVGRATSASESETTEKSAQTAASGRAWLPPRVAGGVAFCAALAAVYGGALYELAIYAMGTSLHSHVVLVPFISGYLIAIDRARMPRQGKPSFALAASAALGIIAWVAVTSSGEIGRASCRERV